MKLFNNLSPITFRPKKIIFDLEVGYKFTANRFHFGYAYHFHTNKLNNFILALVVIFIQLLFSEFLPEFIGYSGFLAFGF